MSGKRKENKTNEKLQRAQTQGRNKVNVCGVVMKHLKAGKRVDRQW